MFFKSTLYWSKADNLLSVFLLDGGTSLEFPFNTTMYFQAADRLKSSQRAVRTGSSNSMFAFLPCVLAGSISWQVEGGYCNLVNLCLAEKVLAPAIWENTFLVHCCWQPGAVLDHGLVPHLQGYEWWASGLVQWLRCPGQFCTGYLLLDLSKVHVGCRAAPQPHHFLWAVSYRVEA